MSTATVTTQSPKKLKAARAPLQAECKRLGITHDHIAARAGCTRPYVVQYFSGTRSPMAVELAAQMLVAERKAATGEESRAKGKRSNGRAPAGASRG